MTYDKPITIQVQNQETEKWEDALHLHAHVNKTNGGLSFEAGADRTIASLSFSMRYCKALEDLHYNVQPYRIIYRNHTFKAVDYDDFQEMHQTIKLVGELYG